MEFQIAFEDTTTQRQRTVVLVTFLLLYENTMTKSSYIRQEFIWA